MFIIIVPYITIKSHYYNKLCIYNFFFFILAMIAFMYYSVIVKAIVNAV